EIENLIKKGFLKEFIDKSKAENSQSQNPDDKEPRPDRGQRLAGVIDSIHGGFTFTGESKSARKAYARSANSITSEFAYGISHRKTN
ncbi:hypothetical protein, partial [Klebsiella pneumoniae]|uniref:hypothetical protein n=1 Tax=Klebsiella pneumoniae TaxID=573 RepID=UPI001BE012F8